MIDPSFLKKRKSKWRYPVGAVLFHIAVVGAFILLEIHLRREMIKEEVAKMLEVRPITSEELKRIVTRARVVETQWVEEKDLVPVANQKAYGGERTQRVKEETRSIEKGSVRGNDTVSKAKTSLVLNKKASDSKALKVDTFGRNLKKSEKSKLKKGNYESLDPAIKVSDLTILNTDAYIYATFINRMKESIVAAWGPRWRKVAEKKKSEMTAGVYVTVTRIHIDRDGTVTKVGIDLGSGHAEIDKAASDAIREVISFPNPPPEIFGPTMNGSFNFTFKISLIPERVFRFNFLPDDRLDRAR